MRRDGAGVEGCDDQIDSVDCKGEVCYELASGDEEENRDDAVLRVLLDSIVHIHIHACLVWIRFTYVIKESSIQHNPSVHPVVTSPLKFRQSSRRPALGWRPATKVVKIIRMSPTA
jgi:hypothetical protein